MTTVREAMEAGPRWALHRGYDPYNSANHLWWRWVASLGGKVYA